MSSSNGNIVKAHGVTKTFKRGAEIIRVLADLNLDIPDGEFLALMGPSGSGKSTFLNLVGGLDSPDSGSIEVAGDRIDSMGSRKLRAGGRPTSASSSSSTTCCRCSTPPATSSCRCC